jgi:hypothetical protein
MNPYPTPAEVAYVNQVAYSQFVPQAYYYDGPGHPHGYPTPRPVFIGHPPSTPLGNGFFGGNFGAYPFGWNGGGTTSAINLPYPYLYHHGHQGYYSPAYYGTPIPGPGFGLAAFVNGNRPDLPTRHSNPYQSPTWGYGK